jgi:hypothetical protein
MLFTKCLHLKSSPPPPSPNVTTPCAPVSRVNTRAVSKSASSETESNRPPAGMPSSPSKQNNVATAHWSPPAISNIKSSRTTRRSAGLSSREYSIACSPLKKFGPRSYLKKSENIKQSKNKTNNTFGNSSNIGHNGTAHILNTNSPQITRKQAKMDLQHARMAGGMGSSRELAERNLTTSTSFRSLRAPKQQPPWTKKEMRQYLADAVATGNTDNSTLDLDQQITRVQVEVDTLNSRIPTKNGHNSVSSTTTITSNINNNISTATPVSSSNNISNGTDSVLTSAPATPHDHVDAIKHHLNNRIRTRQNHIANSAVAECSFVESLPASRSVLHHPEYTKLSKQAYRFELDAQVRANRARERVEQVRAVKMAARSQEYLQQASLARETKDEIDQARRKRETISSLDAQIRALQKKKQEMQQQKELEHRDIRYLHNALDSATSQREKLVEAHHESEQVLHLLKWQKLHREVDRQRKSSTSKKKKTSTPRRNGIDRGRKVK